MTAPDLRKQSAAFASNVQTTIASALPGDIAIQSEAIAGEDRFWVRPAAENGKRRIKLLVGGEHLADLGVTFQMSWDQGGSYLKTQQSAFVVHSILSGAPLVRLEFDFQGTTPPVAHWHVHAESGAFSHMLSKAHSVDPDRVSKPHDLSALHFPVGGERFRPCLEDLLEFMIAECGIDANVGWQRALAAGRENWRRMQVRAMTRDAQQEVADVLRKQGWTVTPPNEIGTENYKVFQRW